MNKIKLTGIFLLLSCTLLNAQSGYDSKSLNRLVDSFEKTFELFPDSCLAIGQTTLQKSIAAKDSQLIVKSYMLIANSYIAKSKYDNGIAELINAKKILNNYKNPTLAFRVFKNTALLFYLNEKYIEALQNIYQALDIAKNNNNDTLLAKGYLFTANILSRKSIAKYDSALILLSKAETLYKKLKLNEFGLLYYYYGTTYSTMGDSKNSISYFNKAIDEYKKANDTTSIIAASKELGDIYYYLNENKLSLKYYTEAFELQQKIKNKNTESIALLACDIGYMYALQGDMDKFRFYEKAANEYANKAVGWLAKNYTAQWFSDIHEKKGNYKEAFVYLQKFNETQDSLLQKQSIEKVAKAEADMNAQFKLELAKKEEEQKQKEQRLIRNTFIGGFIISLLLLLYVFRNYKEKKKANLLIQEQKTEVESQKYAIEEKNREITDSINYAKRIQEAILPSDEALKQTLGEFFVLYIPKDIVSGDFYWSFNSPPFLRGSTPNTNVGGEGPTYISAIDCTGHGVPGAFMSMLAKNGLNSCIEEKKLTTPSEILTELNQFVSNSLNKGIHGDTVRDGMDIALCSLNRSSGELQFAGAMNGLYHYHNGEMNYIKGDRHAIGGQTSDDKKVFTNHNIQLKPNDVFYIYTDGYGDQFGGKDGKKYKQSKLKEVLTEIATLPLIEQKNILHKNFFDWKGDLEQIDDILIIGVKYTG